MLRAVSLLAGFVTFAGVAGASPMVTPSHFSVEHHPVTTSNAQAQAAFDEGLTLLFAFNRLAARHAFERAAAADPKLAMAFWGVAQSYGPNVNEPIDEAGEKAAVDALTKARSLAGGASENENAYVAALGVRYSAAPHPNFSALARAYERAMSELAHRFPDDLDAATLFAESEMDLHAWQWFSPVGQPAEGSNEIIATLESVLARDPMHIGANHFYIHATEESLHPERALLSAERLGTFSFEPAAAHLVHMPAHTYMRSGYYDLAVSSNVHATEHDRTYLAGEPDREASSYYGHNLLFLASAYQMEGNFAGASDAAAMLSDQGAVIPQLFAFCRFSRWHDILERAAPKPSDDEPMRIAVWHYARGLAFAGLNDVSNAQKERQILSELDRGLGVQSVVGWYNGSKAILGIALDVLDAKIALARSKPAAAVPLLTRAVKSQDGLLYIEPPDWYYPIRESLGAAQLRAGDAKDAERTFRDDLLRNPRSGRSLFGLAESLKVQGDATDAAWAQRQFDAAWRNADTQLSIENL
jgi:hypothetical protein